MLKFFPSLTTLIACGFFGGGWGFFSDVHHSGKVEGKNQELEMFHFQSCIV